MSLINEFSIQLYSVREELEKDFRGTVEKIAKIGYTGVEFAGYGGLSATEMKTLLADNGLKSVGTHVGMDRLRNHLEEELAYNATLGTEYIICPHYTFENQDSILKYAEECRGLAEKCQKAGFKFGYHNHAHEFEKMDGEYPLDILFQNTGSHCVMELDMYWASYAGVDALDYMSRNAGKVELLHIKQIKDFETRACVDLDEGVLDFQEIIPKAKEVGVKHFILEQEEFAVSPYVSIQKDFDYIMGL